MDQEDRDLAQMLSEVARTFSGEQSLDDTLWAITDSAVSAVPGADFASITLVRNRREVQSVAATDVLVTRADKAQEEYGEGPCMSALYEHDTFRIDDVEQEQRWPQFRAAALELGVRSILSFQLYTDRHNLGALNLYSLHAHAFKEAEAEHVGLMFATHASVALRGAQQEKELKRAIETRDVIGMAKGILVERHKLTPDQAFDVLVRHRSTGTSSCTTSPSTWCGPAARPGERELAALATCRLDPFGQGRTRIGRSPGGGQTLGPAR